ncbi:MAG: hypothetical protein AB7Q81_04985 [Gammaproteobacteria bacterium]
MAEQQTSRADDDRHVRRPPCATTGRSIARRMAFMLGALAGAVSVAVPAATIDWANPGGGSFGTSFFWLPASVPGAADIARFNLPATYQVSFASNVTNDRLQVRSGVVTFDMNGHGYALNNATAGVFVGLNAGDNAELKLKGPGGGLSLASGARIGENAGAVGRVAVGDGTFWNNQGILLVGNGGNGELRIETGGEVSNTAATIGDNAGSLGSVAVLDGTWTSSGDLTVGNAGSGALAIDGGEVSNVTGYVGRAALSSGTVTVANGSWRNRVSPGADRDLFVGHAGQGTLNINAAGVVTNADGYLGHDTTGLGIAIVNGGAWNNSGDLTVGHAGDGELTITGGGSVTSDIAIVGALAGSSGAVTIASGNWFVGGDLRVANAGQGELLIGADGQMNNAFGVIGLASGSDGLVTVAGGNWINNGSLLVGSAGTGRLMISNGGTVTSNLGRIGQVSGASGEVTVGNGHWFNTGSLAVGIGGTGILTINDSGEVSSDDVFVGLASAGSGKVSVGPGQLNVGDTLRVGDLGNGVLEILAGGQVSNSIGTIGSSNGVSGTVTVSGGSWNSTDWLAVGDSGHGELSITGGQVTSGTAVLGWSSAGSGEARVSGAASRWSVNGSLNLGGDESVARGSGLLRIDNGALVSVTGATRLWQQGTLILQGGRLRTGTVLNDGGTLALLSGELELTGPLVIGTGATTTFGDVLNVGPGLSVVSSGSITRVANDGELIVSGSTASFTAAGTGASNQGVITVTGGTLTLANQLAQGGILNALNATINGSVRNLPGADVVVSGVTHFNALDPADVFVNEGEVHVAGTAIFDINVAGPGYFSQNGTTVFNRGYSPGASPGVVVFGGDMELGTDGELLLEIAGYGGAGAADGHDQLQVAGNATVTGMLSVALLDDFVPVAGDVFDVLLAESISGAFSDFQFAALGAGLEWQFSIVADFDGTADVARLAVVSTVPLPGALWLLVPPLALLVRRRGRRCS